MISTPTIFQTATLLSKMPSPTGAQARQGLVRAEIRRPQLWRRWRKKDGPAFHADQRTPVRPGNPRTN